MRLSAEDLRALGEAVASEIRGAAAPRGLEEVRERLSFVEQAIGRWRKLLGAMPPFSEEDRGALAWQLAVDEARRELLRWFLGCAAAEVPFWKGGKRGGRSTWTRPPIPDPPR